MNEHLSPQYLSKEVKRAAKLKGVGRIKGWEPFGDGGIVAYHANGRCTITKREIEAAKDDAETDAEYFRNQWPPELLKSV